MPKATVERIEKQKAALKSREDEAYAALKDAEDATFELEDRIARRGDRVSLEGE